MIKLSMTIGRQTVWLFILMLVYPMSIAAQSRESGPWIHVDRVVAAIGEIPVLESDILMEIDLGLLGSSKLGDDPDVLLQAYLNRMLILREVEEVGAFRLTSGQSEGAYQGYLLQYENMADYRTKLQMWGIDEDEVRTRLERALLASLYTESRIQFFINILPSDIEKTFEEDRLRWGDATLYEAWESIKSDLLQSTYRLERDRWLNTLRQRYDLKIFSSIGAAK